MSPVIVRTIITVSRFRLTTIHVMRPGQSQITATCLKKRLNFHCLNATGMSAGAGCSRRMTAGPGMIGVAIRFRHTAASNSTGIHRNETKSASVANLPDA